MAAASVRKDAPQMRTASEVVKVAVSPLAAATDELSEGSPDDGVDVPGWTRPEHTSGGRSLEGAPTAPSFEKASVPSPLIMCD
jgi:hypothetical protein